MSSCWITTGDWTHLQGAVGPFGLLPGLWQRLDVPDIALLATPASSLVIAGQEDPLFLPESMEEAARQIQEGYRWAGCPERFEFHFPKKAHCLDLENQEVAWDWLARWLRPGS